MEDLQVETPTGSLSDHTEFTVTKDQGAMHHRDRAEDPDDPSPESRVIAVAVRPIS